MTIYLYKKTHNLTGLKYLGKTISKDPYKYTGSGVYWTNHLKKHGYDVTTEILKECQTETELASWGQHYSKLWNIVESSDWANLKEEAGPKGTWSNKSKQKLSNTKKEELSRLTPEELTARVKKSCCNPESYTKDRANNISVALTGLVRSKSNRENSQMSAVAHRKSLSTVDKQQIYGKQNAGKTWKLINGKRVWIEKDVV
jgi:hypothetical protein